MNTYPPVGAIMVSKSGGALVHVWPDESDNKRCFTGVNIMDGDCSTLWIIDHFERFNLFKCGLIERYRAERKRFAGSEQ